MSWIADLQSYIDRIPYGDINLQVKRVDRKTVEVTTYGKETLQYNNNEQALDDIALILNRLADNGFDGRATLELQYKKGKIRIVGVFDKKVTRY